MVQHARRHEARPSPAAPTAWTDARRPAAPGALDPDGVIAAPTPWGKLARAKLALDVERLWRAQWPATGVVLLFLALALSGWLPALGLVPHAAALALFGVALGVALWWGFRRFRWPSDEEAWARLERDSRLEHRPLAALRDRLATAPAAGTDPMAQALWRLHKERLAASLARLRVARARPDMPSHDPLALRLAVLLLLVVAAVAAGDAWRERLVAALSPQFAAEARVVTALDLWVTPPEYTRVAPIFLASAGRGPAAPAAEEGDRVVRVPAGSVVAARLTGGRTAPVLRVGEAETRFAPLESAGEGPRAFEATSVLTEGRRITVERLGRTLGSWPIDIVADTAPVVNLAEPPSATQRLALKLVHQARDDYGLASLSATITLDNEEAALAAGEPPIALTLPVPGAQPAAVAGTTFHDLTAHPWAGLPVRVRLTATDALGQVGTSLPETVVLPERSFRHPVAREIITQRRRLSEAPQARTRIAATLRLLGEAWEAYDGDFAVYLGLLLASDRLVADQAGESLRGVQQVLWDTALRVEEGGLPQAERELRALQQQLMEALQDPETSDAEIARLMQELQQALQNYMREMAENLQERMERGEPVPEITPEMAERMIDSDAFQQMLDQMRELSQSGSREQAARMLEQMQQMLENLQMGAEGMPQGEDPAWQMMQDLQRMAELQQRLLDENLQRQRGLNPDDDQPQDGQRREQGQQGEQQGEQGQQGQQGRQRGQQGQGQQQGEQGQQGQQGQQQRQQGLGQQPGSGFAEQQALEGALGELQRRMGEMGMPSPGELDEAREAMRDAARALGQGDEPGAVPGQTQAADALRRGLESMAQAMAERMRQQMGQMGIVPMPGRGQAMGRDPFGRNRPNNGMMLDGSDVDVPDEQEMGRVQEILRELRRRAGEYRRPQYERDYIERILRGLR